MKKNDPYVTKSELEAILDEKFSKFTEDILEVIRDFADRVDERFNRLEAKVDAIGIANQARDAQLTRHERWHYQIANKVGVSLNPEI